MCSNNLARKRTRIGCIVMLVGVLYLIVYNPKIALSLKNTTLIRTGISNFFNDKTFPSPHDPKARCSLGIKD